MRTRQRIEAILGRARRLGRSARQTAGRIACPVVEALRLRVLPVLAIVTSLGWTVLGISFGCWLVGWRLGWKELMLAATACLILVVVATAFTIGRTLLAVTVEVRPRRVPIGGAIAGSITVRNVSRRRLLPIRLEVPVGAATARFDLPSMSADEKHEELFVVPTNRRAVIPVGPVTTVRGDPLGLLRRAVPWTEVTEIFVYPRLISLDPSGWGFLRDLEGRPTLDLSNSDLAFHTLRDYVPGDDRRYIHWRSTARTGRLMVRQFVDTRRSHLVVVVDGSAASYDHLDDFELALSVGGSIALRNLRDEQDTTLLAGNGLIVRTNGPHALDALARADLVKRTLTDTVGAAYKAALDVSMAVVVTGALVPFAEIRRATGLLPPDARIVVIRVDPSRESSISSVSGVRILSMRVLDDLGALVRAVAAA
jgi:uncharacterized protein (DUF58 family)